MKTWHKVLENAEELPEGRVMTVTAGHHDICLAHFEGKFCALDNKCPHQGGPLGEGSIENGWLRCPWHGWDFHPCTGLSPGAHEDGVSTFEVRVVDNEVFVALEEAAPHQKTVSDLMVETMIEWGVNRVFGMVGHSNLGLADAFRRQEEKGNLQYIGIRHEGAASFAASAYGKLTGRPAACFAIAGPGSTNMFTGLWDAKVDRAPILALTGQVATQVVGTGNFQELDLVRAFGTVAEFNHRVLTTSDHSELMALAVKQATLQRDVSHITFPDEIQVLPVAETQAVHGPQGRITPLQIAPPEESFEKAVKMIRAAKRPVIITGHGARFHMAPIIGLAEKLNCPVMTTFKAKGQIPDRHPLAAGVLGRSGTPIASWLMNESDLMIVFGASFSKHTGISPKVPTIQVDFDPLALAKFHPIEVQVYGEISVTAQMLGEAIDGQSASVDQRPDIKARWELWLKEKAQRLQEDHGKGLSAIAVFDALNHLAPEDAVMCVDVGNNAYAFGRYYESKAHNSFLMSGYLGSIGFALPAAIGAWAAVGDTRPVMAVAGDGGFGQYMAEWTTAVKYNMPIKVILLNNQELGKISKEQRAADLAVYQTSLVNPHFADFAQSAGGMGLRVEQRKDLFPALEKALAYPGPALVEVMTDVTLL